MLTNFEEKLEKKLAFLNKSKLQEVKDNLEKFKDYYDDISSNLYEKLENDDQIRFIIWFCKRWLKVDFIDEEEFSKYQETITKIKNEKCEKVTLNNKEYKLQNMKYQGYNFKLAAYSWVLSVHDVYYNQYEHKEFKVSKGDVIIDVGGFIGDTAALFCEKTLNDCEIHSFELLDENIELFKYNNSINKIEANVFINKLALSNSSNEKLFIHAKAIQGATTIFGNGDSKTEITTITLDDYVKEKNISAIDFIKMDIEGSEMLALEGSINSIKKFKPKLALCLYHKWDDVITIPKFIQSLNLEYKFYFKWVQLTDGWEAVLLAQPIEGK